MTVSNLMSKLKDCAPNAEVVLPATIDHGDLDIVGIESDGEKVRLYYVD